MSVAVVAAPRGVVLYRTVWRWHFYAGLFVMPFVLLLSVTGAIYLFKPQIDRWEERGYRGLPQVPAVSPLRQAEAALASEPGARLSSYRVPLAPGDAALVHVGLPDGGMRDVFVAPSGEVLARVDPEGRISAVVARLHGKLLIGRYGDWLVELAASWAVVMIVTGLYLWWPKGERGGRGLAGVVWPRRRAGLRDLHAVTGFWVSGLTLVMLASGLPWSGVWGSTFKLVREELGLTKGRPDWKIGAAAGEHAAHDHVAMGHTMPPTSSLALLPQMVAHARAERLAFPALVVPPGAAQRFGPALAGWTIKSEAQDRTLVRSITYDTAGSELKRTGFADKHPIDRLINYGISWHEGQLFGWINQLVGVLTAAALVGMASTSFLLWQRRRPDGTLGAPPPSREGAARGVTLIVLALCLVLPMLALSLAALLLVEWLVLRRVPGTARWLGLRAANA